MCIALTFECVLLKWFLVIRCHSPLNGGLTFGSRKRLCVVFLCFGMAEVNLDVSQPLREELESFSPEISALSSVLVRLREVKKWTECEGFGILHCRVKRSAFGNEQSGIDVNEPQESTAADSIGMDASTGGAGL